MLRYAITDGGIVPGHAILMGRELAARSAGVALGGVDFLLVREKQLEAGELAAVARMIVAAVDGRARVLIAQRVDVALAVGADGVHLSSAAGELRVGQVRRLMPDGFVSVACHSVDEVRRAREDEADAVLFGPVFGKWVGGVEVVAGVGVERLREACGVAGEMKVFALGGVSEGNAGMCLEAGAAGIAGIRVFFT